MSLYCLLIEPYGIEINDQNRRTLYGKTSFNRTLWN